MRKLFLAILFLVSACAPVYKHEIVFNPKEPLRVAVLPFLQVDPNGKPTEPDVSLLIDNLSIVSSKMSLSPTEYVRRVTQNELGKTSLDLIAPGVVDSRLAHNGFTKVDLSGVDVAKVFTSPASEICGKLLQCDAVLYGTISRWDRSYYAIQSVNSVGIDLKLVRASDNKVLFNTHGEDADSRGLTKGPTGFSDLVLEPIKGLDNQIITDLAARVVKQMLAPLRVDSRPEYLKSAPPAILASAHDAENGQLASSGRLTVLAYGTAKQTASFSIGSVIQNLPMAELDDGHYIGEYLPLPSDRFVSQPIVVALTDEFGRATKQRVGQSEITFTGRK